MADPPGDPVDVAAVRERVLSGHRSTIAGVLSAADAVAEGWSESHRGSKSVSDRSAVVDPLRAKLDRRGLDERLIDLLVDAVGAAGRELPADPVPAPPYLAVTSRGPVCRATLSDGRLVVAVRAFRVERSREETGRSGGEREGDPAGGSGTGARYVRAGEDPAGSLNVSFKARKRGNGKQ